jgi:hypothetical protein
MDSRGDLHARRAALASRRVAIRGSRAGALGLRRLPHGTSVGRAAKIFGALRSRDPLAHHPVHETRRDQRFADAARSREQVRLRRPIAQFGEQPGRKLAMASQSV